MSRAVCYSGSSFVLSFKYSSKDSVLGLGVWDGAEEVTSLLEFEVATSDRQIIYIIIYYIYFIVLTKALKHIPIKNYIL